jgi:hypothetical protein
LAASLALFLFTYINEGVQSGKETELILTPQAEAIMLLL